MRARRAPLGLVTPHPSLGDSTPIVAEKFPSTFSIGQDQVSCPMHTISSLVAIRYKPLVQDLSVEHLVLCEHTTNMCMASLWIWAVVLAQSTV